MPGEDPVQVWVVNPEGQFVEQGEPCCCEDPVDEDQDIPMLFEDDPV